jgi:hypothetical protein
MPLPGLACGDGGRAIGAPELGARRWGGVSGCRDGGRGVLRPGGPCVGSRRAPPGCRRRLTAPGPLPPGPYGSESCPPQKWSGPQIWA